MCGLVGIVGPDARRHLPAVERMVDAVSHRGPDGRGLFISPSGRCVLGFRRLAILDLSDEAAQPMATPDGRFTLVYNGEAYNFAELREELANNGVETKTRGDTEVVLHLLARHGAGALSSLNAMFALALWDERAGTVLLARDRFGQKPLYFTVLDEHLIFASEVRALLASGLVSRRVDTESLGSFLSYGAVQGPRTIVAGVSLLQNATWRTFGSDGLGPSIKYWSPPMEKHLGSSDLRDAFTAAVRRHLVSDAPIGLFLSGGTDSSAIAAAAMQASPQPVRTLSVVFPDQPEICESEHSRRMARVAGTDHLEFPLDGQQMLALLPKALEAMDQPTVDGINTYTVSHAAHQAGLKVALSGLGGDELFAGYGSFRDVPRMVHFRRLAGLLRLPLVAFLRAAGPYGARVSKALDLLEASPGLLPAYLARRRLFTSRQIRHLAPGLVRKGWYSGQTEERFEELTRLVAGREPGDSVGLLEMEVYMGQQLLRDTDAMGMAHGLEIRVPFLDREFAHLALASDASVRKSRTPTKAPFVEALGDWLPREITHRPKAGFAMPFAAWMLGALHDSVAEGIAALATAGSPVCEREVRRVWRDFRRQPGRVNWSRPWSLFVLGRYLAQHRLSI